MDIEKRLIDANEEIRKIQSVLDEHQNEKDTTAYQAFEAFITCLENAPTVDAVEVVHGRWIEKIKDERFGEEWDEIALYECSACKSEFVEGMGQWRYCPNCGAKIDGGCADGSV